MSRFIFAALGSVCLAGAAAAQPVPGRDLLEFPVGLLAEPAPLSTQMTGGLWNPATAALPASRRAAFGYAGLVSPQELGVGLNFAAGAYRLNRTVTASLSLVSASVNDVIRTDTDPQSIPGPEIPYGTLLISGGLARTMRNNITLGLAARYRRGTSDVDNSSAFTLDGGVVVDGIAGVPVRFAASTFLFTPVSTDREAMYSAAADVPVFRRDSALVVRIGQAFSVTEERGREQYSFSTVRYGQLDLSTGIAHSAAFGNVNNRWRLGCGLRYASYTIAIGREAGAAGVGASYQFLFKRVVQ
jgi:hypothetical protein